MDHTARAKVLIVDDDETIVEMLSIVLGKQYQVLTAPDGSSALRLLAEHEVVGVVADHMMPGMTGVDVLDRSQALRPNAARILITASDQVDILAAAINQARVHRFVSKPLRVTELPLLLAEAVREAHLEEDNARLARELSIKNEELQRINQQLEREIAQRTAAVNKLEQLALHDGLTELYNHRYLQQALDAEVSRAKRHAQPLGLLFIDVDFFKSYNDSHGHPAGDELLRGIARILTRGAEQSEPRSRASDVVARYGGEEFVVVLPQTDLNGSLIKAERIRADIEQHVFEGEASQPGGQITVSIGVACVPDHAADRAGLIEAADRALYRAKEAGRNRVCAAELTSTPRGR